jgi:DNA polymerase III gamma/tau subunit
VLTLIARQSTGAMRDAISLLDQLSSTGQKITLLQAQEVLGTATNQVVVDLIKNLIARNPGEGFNAIHQALDSGTDARQFARQVVEYLRSLLLVRLGNADQVDATTEMRAIMAKHAQAFELDHLLETIRLFNNAASDTKGSWQPGLLLELALAEAIEIPYRQVQPALQPRRRPLLRRFASHNFPSEQQPPDWPDADLTPPPPARLNRLPNAHRPLTLPPTCCCSCRRDAGAAAGFWKSQRAGYPTKLAPDSRHGEAAKRRNRSPAEFKQTVGYQRWFAGAWFSVGTAARQNVNRREYRDHLQRHR